MFELSNGFCVGGVSKGKINLVELSNVRVNGQSSYRMLTVIRNDSVCVPIKSHLWYRSIFCSNTTSLPQNLAIIIIVIKKHLSN